MDQANRILVSVWVMPTPSKHIASGTYNDLRSAGSADWGCLCPQQGPGAEICDAQKDFSRATQAGEISQNHRYVFHTLAFYISLSNSPEAQVWVRSAADAAVRRIGPQNYSE
ncbi:hypothetical protein ABZ769_34705 [Streptomyces olivoreticuli]